MAKKTTKPVVLDMFKHDEKFNDINFYINNKYYHYDIEHTHTFYECTFVASGSILNKYNNDINRLTKNDIIYSTPKCTHQLLFDKNNDYVIYNLEINKDFLSDLILSLTGMNVEELFKLPLTYLRFSNSESAEILQLFNIAQTQTNTRDKQFYLKLILIKYLTKLITSLDNAIQTNVQHSEIINTMLKELNNIDNFSLSCSKIADKLGYSQEYIIRLFKRAGLDTPNKIFLKNKLVHSTILLANSKIKIVNVAELCGIYSISYFNTAFKKEFGISPSQYRKKLSPIALNR